MRAKVKLPQSIVQAGRPPASRRVGVNQVQSRGGECGQSHARSLQVSCAWDPAGQSARVGREDGALVPAGVAALRRMDWVTCGMDAGAGGKWRAAVGG